MRKNKAMILLSQINREGEKSARLTKGAYAMHNLAEINSLERESRRIFTVYSDDGCRASGELKVAMVKHRGGRPLEDPVALPTTPEYYVVGSIDGGSIDFAAGDPFDIMSSPGSFGQSSYGSMLM